MPKLRSAVLNCNQINVFDGLEDLDRVTALVLDNNRIHSVPYNSLMGCKSLRYLHLEHNRISNIPRLPHLANLTALFLAFNRIQVSQLGHYNYVACKE
jgi:Leucine-rich repeat (LRR) protein